MSAPRRPQQFSAISPSFLCLPLPFCAPLFSITSNNQIELSDADSSSRAQRGIPLRCSTGLPVPFACPLFSTTSNNQISQPLCFDNDANCPRGGGWGCDFPISIFQFPIPTRKTLHTSPFVFMRFRTLCTPWRFTTPSPSTTCALFPTRRRGEGLRVCDLRFSSFDFRVCRGMPLPSSNFDFPISEPLRFRVGLLDEADAAGGGFGALFGVEFGERGQGFFGFI